MVIDDSPVVRKILEVCLRREGIDQLIFSDGLTALQAMHKQPDCIPAAIVLDLHLPDINGFAIARLLRASAAYDRTTLLVLTGYNSMWNRWKARFIRNMRFMTKPFKTQEILGVIQEILLQM